MAYKWRINESSLMGQKSSSEGKLGQIHKGDKQNMQLNCRYTHVFADKLLSTTNETLSYMSDKYPLNGSLQNELEWGQAPNSGAKVGQKEQ